MTSKAARSSVCASSERRQSASRGSVETGMITDSRIDDTGAGRGPLDSRSVMPPSVTVVIDPYGEYRRPRMAGIPFESTLRALLAQSYPAELTTILLTCTAPEVPIVRELVADEPRIRVVGVPEGSGYYQKKNLGMREATTDIVLLADGDCMYPPDWIAEMVAAFDRGGDRVVYVQGVSRFAPGPYAHILNPVYWRGYEAE